MNTVFETPQAEPFAVAGQHGAPDRGLVLVEDLHGPALYFGEASWLLG
jgi:hypothetical protein